MQGCPKSSCKNLLDSNDTPDDISLEKLLEKAEINMMVYLQALSICRVSFRGGGGGGALAPP